MENIFGSSIVYSDLTDGYNKNKIPTIDVHLAAPLASFYRRIFWTTLSFTKYKKFKHQAKVTRMKLY